MIAFILTVGLVGFYLALRIFVRSIWHRRWLKELKALAINERNRNRFGILRTELMRLAREEELNMHGETFKVMYSMITMLMRNPDSYQEIANSLSEIPKAVRVSQEKQNQFYTKGEAKVIRDFAKNLDLLFKDYSRPYRWISRYHDFKQRNSVPWIPLWFKMMFNDREEIQEAKRMRESQEALFDFAEKELAHA